MSHFVYAHSGYKESEHVEIADSECPRSETGACLLLNRQVGFFGITIFYSSGQTDDRGEGHPAA